MKSSWRRIWKLKTALVCIHSATSVLFHMLQRSQTMDDNDCHRWRRANYPWNPAGGGFESRRWTWYVQCPICYNSILFMWSDDDRWRTTTTNDTMPSAGLCASPVSSARATQSHVSVSMPSSPPWILALTNTDAQWWMTNKAQRWMTVTNNGWRPTMTHNDERTPTMTDVTDDSDGQWQTINHDAQWQMTSTDNGWWWMAATYNRRWWTATNDSRHCGYTFILLANFTYSWFLLYLVRSYCSFFSFLSYHAFFYFSTLPYFFHFQDAVYFFEQLGK